MISINKDNEGMLPHSKLLEILDYNSETGIFINKITRGPRGVKGSIAGTMDRKGYIVIKINNIQYKAHRLAWFYMNKEWPSDLIDHKDQNKSNNMFSNLRDTSNMLNCRNSGLRANNTSGFKGVWKESRSGKWGAQFRYLGEFFYLGAFNTPELAAEAYNAFEKEFII